MNTRDAITQLIFISDTPKCADIAIVLGCSSVSSMEPAISLYHRGMVKKILISGKGPNDRHQPEWRIYSSYGLDQGIPSSAMMIEPEARNTRENFIFSEKLLSREIGWENINNIAIVTNPVHARRAKMTARRFFPAHVNFTILVPSDEEALQADSWWKTRYGRQMVLDELRRIGEYGTRGDLADF